MNVSHSTRLFLTAMLGVSFASSLSAATTSSWMPSIAGVSQTTVSCTPGSLINCRIQDVDQVSCPAGTVPGELTVSLGGLEMRSNIQADVQEGFEPGCYNVEEIQHLLLQLRVPAVPGIEVDGGPGCTTSSPFEGTTVAEGAPVDCADVSPWNNSLPLLWYGQPGESISESNVCVTTRPQTSWTFNQTSPEWATFYGTGTFGAEFTARADANTSRSASWGAEIVTPATGQLQVLVRCTPENDENGVPAVNAFGIAVLASALAGMGLLVGFRRQS